MMYRVLGASALLCVAFGQDVASLRDQLQSMKSQLANANTGGGGGDDEGSAPPPEVSSKDAGSFPKNMYQGSADQKNGNYQQYMDQYSKGNNYTKYMESYHQYITKYASGNQGSQQYQKYLDKYAEGNQGGDYQQYMNEYAGQGGSQGNYQQYYGKYMNKYAQNSNQYANYQMYIERYSHHLSEEEGGVGSPADAKTVKQLDQWRSASRQNVEWYCPSQYNQYASESIDKQYNKRLNELQGSGVAQTDPLNLDAVATPQAAEAGVHKVEKMSENLKKANADHESVEDQATLPAKNVAAVYSERSMKLGKEIRSLQEQVKSKKDSAELEKQLHQKMYEAKNLRDDELKALDQAHRDAKAVVSHAARGAQTAVRKQARQTVAGLHRLARKDRAYQADADKLEKRMDTAADSVDDQSEELARSMKAHLDQNLQSAREEVGTQAERRMDDLQEALTSLAESEVAELPYGVLGLMALASFAITFAALVAKRSSQTIALQKPMLG